MTMTPSEISRFAETLIRLTPAKPLRRVKTSKGAAYFHLPINSVIKSIKDLNALPPGAKIEKQTLAGKAQQTLTKQADNKWHDASTNTVLPSGALGPAINKATLVYKADPTTAPSAHTPATDSATSTITPSYLDSLPTGTQLVYKPDPTKDVSRIYTKQDDSLWAGPSGVHPSSAFQVASDSGKLSLAGSHPAPTTDPVSDIPTKTDAISEANAQSDTQAPNATTPKANTASPESVQETSTPVDTLSSVKAGSPVTHTQELTQANPGTVIRHSTSSGLSTQYVKQEDGSWLSPSNVKYHSALMKTEIANNSLTWVSFGEVSKADLVIKQKEEQAKAATPPITTPSFKASGVVPSTAHLDQAPNGTEVTNKLQTATYTKTPEGWKSKASGKILDLTPAVNAGNLLYVTPNQSTSTNKAATSTTKPTPSHTPAPKAPDLTPDGSPGPASLKALAEKSTPNKKAVSDAQSSEPPLDVSPAAAMVSEINTLVEELNGKGIKLDTKTQLGSGGRKLVTVSRIEVPKAEQGEGKGMAAMRRLLEITDVHGATVQLTPTQDFGGIKSKLIAWYKGLGFVSNSGKNKDYELYETMYREPKAPAPAKSEVKTDVPSSDGLSSVVPSVNVGSKKFEVLDDPGASGDGHFPPSGMWGKYGAAGVMIRHIDTEPSSVPGEPDKQTERFLMVQRGMNYSKPGMWQLPGGGLNSKENAYQGAARETVEELQAPLDFIAGLKPVGELVFEKQGWKYTNITADSPTMFIPKIDPDEINDARWMTREELAGLASDGKLNPALAKSFDAIMAHFDKPEVASAKIVPDDPSSNEVSVEEIQALLEPVPEVPVTEVPSGPSNPMALLQKLKAAKPVVSQNELTIGQNIPTKEAFEALPIGTVLRSKYDTKYTKVSKTLYEKYDPDYGTTGMVDSFKLLFYNLTLEALPKTTSVTEMPSEASSSNSDSLNTASIKPKVGDVLTEALMESLPPGTRITTHHGPGAGEESTYRKLPNDKWLWEGNGAEVPSTGFIPAALEILELDAGTNSDAASLDAQSSEGPSIKKPVTEPYTAAELDALPYGTKVQWQDDAGLILPDYVYTKKDGGTGLGGGPVWVGGRKNISSNTHSAFVQQNIGKLFPVTEDTSGDKSSVNTASPLDQYSGPVNSLNDLKTAATGSQVKDPNGYTYTKTWQDVNGGTWESQGGVQYQGYEIGFPNLEWVQGTESSDVVFKVKGAEIYAPAGSKVYVEEYDLKTGNGDPTIKFIKYPDNTWHKVDSTANYDPDSEYGQYGPTDIQDFPETSFDILNKYVDEPVAKPGSPKLILDVTAKNNALPIEGASGTDGASSNEPSVPPYVGDLDWEKFLALPLGTKVYSTVGQEWTKTGPEEIKTKGGMVSSGITLQNTMNGAFQPWKTTENSAPEKVSVGNIPKVIKATSKAGPGYKSLYLNGAAGSTYEHVIPEGASVYITTGTIPGSEGSPKYVKLPAVNGNASMWEMHTTESTNKMTNGADWEKLLAQGSLTLDPGTAQPENANTGGTSDTGSPDVGSVLFFVQSTPYEVPVGSKVYHGALEGDDSDTAYFKYVLYPDGSWSRFSPVGEVKYNPESPIGIAGLEANVAEGKFALDSKVVTKAPLVNGPNTDAGSSNAPSYKQFTYVQGESILYGDDPKRFDALPVGTVLQRVFDDQMWHRKDDGKWYRVGSKFNGATSAEMGSAEFELIYSAALPNSGALSGPITSYGDIADAPVGTQIQDNVSTWTKVDNYGVWKSNNGGERSYNDFTLGKATWVSKGTDAGSSNAPSVTYAVADKFTYANSPAKFDALPIGAKIYDIDKNVFWVRQQDGNWYKESPHNGALSAYGFDGAGFADAGHTFRLISLPGDNSEGSSDGTSSNAPSHPNVPIKFKVGSQEFITPAGSKIYHTNHVTAESTSWKYVRLDNGAWFEYGSDGSLKGQDTQAAKHSDESVANGSFIEEVYGPQATTGNTSSTITKSFTLGDLVKAGEMNLAPVGTGVKLDANGKTYTKQTDGLWSDGYVATSLPVGNFANAIEANSLKWASNFTIDVPSYGAPDISGIDPFPEAAAKPVLHPSGLKPGKYGKSLNAKAYMVLNADGTAWYVGTKDKKPLTTKKVLANQKAGMSTYQGAYTGPDLSLNVTGPQAGAPTTATSGAGQGTDGGAQASPLSGPVTFTANVTMSDTVDFTAPAGSIVYHLSGKTSNEALSKFIRHDDGTWSRATPQTGSQMVALPSDLGMQYESYLTSGKLTMDQNAMYGDPYPESITQVYFTANKGLTQHTAPAGSKVFYSTNAVSDATQASSKFINLHKMDDQGRPLWARVSASSMGVYQELDGAESKAYEDIYQSGKFSPDPGALQATVAKSSLVSKVESVAGNVTDAPSSDAGSGNATSVPTPVSNMGSVTVTDDNPITAATVLPAMPWLPLPIDFPALKSNALTALMVELSEQAGYKGIAALNRKNLDLTSKREWIKYWAYGDWDKAYTLELVGGLKRTTHYEDQMEAQKKEGWTDADVKKVNPQKVPDMAALEALPIGAQIVHFAYGTGDPEVYVKMKNANDDGVSTTEWASFRTGQKWNISPSKLKDIIEYGTVYDLSKAEHAKADKHPGSPTFPVNVNMGGFQKIYVPAAVPGEVPAGSSIPASALKTNGLSADLSEFKYGSDANSYDAGNIKSSYSFDTANVDKYLLAAGMKNSQGLSFSQKKEWVWNHLNGNRVVVDNLSISAQQNAKIGQHYSEPLVAPKPVVEVGKPVVISADTSVKDATVGAGANAEGGLTGTHKPFNIASSHAMNLTEAQVDEYLIQLFTPKAAGVVTKKQPLDVKRAIVQLHWLSTQSDASEAMLSKAVKRPDIASAEFVALRANIETQVASQAANQYNSYSNGYDDYTLTVPPFAKVTAWAKAPSSEQESYGGSGGFKKFNVVDDTGTKYFFKPIRTGEEWRTYTADAAHRAGRLFGFTPAWSDIITVDDGDGNKVTGQVQGLIPNDGNVENLRPQDLTQRQLNDVLREHLFDWVVNQDDSHAKQFIQLQNGGIGHLDLDRAWAFWGYNKLMRGQLSTHPSQQGRLYHEDVYQAIVDGKIDPTMVQKAYATVMQRARMMERTSDAKYREILEYGPAKNPKLGSEASKAQFIESALARKNSVSADFTKFWDDLFAEAKIEKPTASMTMAPGLYTGFSPELIEQAKLGRNWGHAVFYAGTDLEDGHLMIWEEQGAGGKPAILNGQGQLLATGDQKFHAWLKENYHGSEPSGGYGSYKSADELMGQSSYHEVVKRGRRTIEYHLGQGDTAFNETSLNAMTETRVKMQNELDNEVYLKWYPGKPKKAEKHREMLEHYIKIVDDAFAAKDQGIAPPPFAGYDYVPVDESDTAPVVLAQPDYVITKRYSASHEAKIDQNTNILTDTGGLTSDGQSGREYVITFPDGAEITYRPWSETSALSQQGVLKFAVPGYQDNAVHGEKIVNFLKDTVGLTMDEATDEDLELQYWRSLYGILSDRSDKDDKPQGNVRKAYNLANPRMMNDKGDELARWREVWSELKGPELVDKFVAEQGYLPRFSRTTLQDHESVHGRPYWMRFDVDVDKLRLTDPFLARSQYGLHGGDGQQDRPLLTAVKSGGVMPGEERMRIVGRWIGGSSGGTAASDSEKGSGSFTMVRQNIENKPYHIYLDPALMARTNTYSNHTDRFGELSYRSSESHWEIGEHTSHSGGDNEAAIKYAHTILSDTVLVVFYGSSDRQKAIDHYKSLGINEINGAPIEEVFVTHYDRSQGLKAAHARMKARVLAGGYDPNAPSAYNTAYVPNMAPAQTSAASLISPVANEAELNAAPQGSIIVGSTLAQDKYIKNDKGGWDPIGGAGGVFDMPSMIVMGNNDGKMSWIYNPKGIVTPGNVTQNQNTAQNSSLKEGDTATIIDMITAPVGSKVLGGEYADVYIKKDNGFWSYADGSGNLTANDIHSNNTKTSGPEVTWKWIVPTASQDKPLVVDELAALPAGTQVSVTGSGSSVNGVYTSNGDGLWTGPAGKSVGSGWLESLSPKLNVTAPQNTGNQNSSQQEISTPYSLGADAYLADMESVPAGFKVMGGADEGSDGDTFTKLPNGLWEMGGDTHTSAEVIWSNTFNGVPLVKWSWLPPTYVPITKPVTSVEDLKTADEGAKFKVGQSVYIKKKDSQGSLKWATIETDSDQYSSWWFSKDFEMAVSNGAAEWLTSPEGSHGPQVTPAQTNPNLYPGSTLISADELSAIPVGGVIKVSDDTASYLATRQADGSWLTDKSISNEHSKMSILFDPKYGVSIVYVSDKPVPEAQPKVDEVSGNTGMVNNVYELDNAPVGSQVTFAYKGDVETHTKINDNYWDSSASSNSVTPDMISGIGSENLTWGPPGRTELSDGPSEPKIWMSPYSLADLDDYPVGTQLQNTNTGSFYMKLPSGQWEQEHGSTLSTVFMKVSAENGDLELVTVPESKYVFSGKVFAYQDILDAPAGSKLTVAGDVYTKNAEGKWNDKMGTNIPVSIFGSATYPNEDYVWGDTTKAAIKPQQDDADPAETAILTKLQAETVPAVKQTDASTGKPATNIIDLKYAPIGAQIKYNSDGEVVVKIGDDAWYATSQGLTFDAKAFETQDGLMEEGDHDWVLGGPGSAAFVAKNASFATATEKTGKITSLVDMENAPIGTVVTNHTNGTYAGYSFKKTDDNEWSGGSGNESSSIVKTYWFDSDYSDYSWGTGGSESASDDSWKSAIGDEVSSYDEIVNAPVGATITNHTYADWGLQYTKIGNDEWESSGGTPGILNSAFQNDYSDHTWGDEYQIGDKPDDPDYDDSENENDYIDEDPYDDTPIVIGETVNSVAQMENADAGTKIKKSNDNSFVLKKDTSGAWLVLGSTDKYYSNNFEEDYNEYEWYTENGGGVPAPDVPLPGQVKSVAELDNAAIGAQIKTEYGDLLTKTAFDNWANIHAKNFGASDIADELSTYFWVRGGPREHEELPGQEGLFGDAPAQAVPAGPEASLPAAPGGDLVSSVESLDAAPAGSTIKDDADNLYTKTDVESQWKDDFGAIYYSGDFGDNVMVWDKIAPMKLATPDNAVADFLADHSAEKASLKINSTEEMALAPVGSVMVPTEPTDDTTWVKMPDYKWHNGGNMDLPGYYANAFDMLVNGGAEWLVTPADAAAMQEFVPTAPTQVTAIKVSSLDRLNAAPVGTKIKHIYSGTVYSKINDSQWNSDANANTLKPYTTGEFSKGVSAGNFVWVTVPSKSGVSNVTEAQKSTGQVVATFSDLVEAPEGASFTLNGAVWTKGSPDTGGGVAGGWFPAGGTASGNGLKSVSFYADVKAGNLTWNDNPAQMTKNEKAPV